MRSSHTRASAPSSSASCAGDRAVHFTYYTYHVTAVTLAWIVGFSPIFARHRRWTWQRGVGLALVAWPFALMALGFVDDVLRSYERYQATGTIFQVLRPVARIVLWNSVLDRILFYAVIPAVGLALLFDAWRRDTRAAADDIGRATGLAPRASWKSDATRGLALFFGLAGAYVIAYGASVLVPASAAGSDETAYWRNLDVPLIVMLSIVPAITEEFLFRGILLNALSRRMGWGWAALTQAVLFGLIHAGYGSWTHVVGPIVFGLGMAWIAREIGWVAAAILHAEVNTLFFVVERWPAYVATNGSAGALALGALVLALVAGGAAALWATRGDAYARLWRSLWAPFRRRKKADPA